MHVFFVFFGNAFTKWGHSRKEGIGLPNSFTDKLLLSTLIIIKIDVGVADLTKYGRLAGLVV